MKGFNILLVLLLGVLSCGQQHKQIPSGDNASAPLNSSLYGEKLGPGNRRSASEMFDLYQGLAASDTIPVKFSGKVTEVCQAKGCWMKVALEKGQEVMITFKDYAFFVPKDIAGKHIVVNGSAFVSEMSIEDQKHFARDSGMDEDAISGIEKPRKSYSFEADGVLLTN